jgi:hypothetical protein
MENDEDRDTVYNALRFDRKLFPNRGVLEAHEGKIATIEKNAAANVVGSDDVKKAFEERMRKDLGIPLRLALLGDKSAMDFYNYDPASSDKTKVRNADDLLKTYENKLAQAAKLRNAES